MKAKYGTEWYIRWAMNDDRIFILSSWDQNSRTNLLLVFSVQCSMFNVSITRSVFCMCHAILLAVPFAVFGIISKLCWWLCHFLSFPNLNMRDANERLFSSQEYTIFIHILCVFQLQTFYLFIFIYSFFSLFSLSPPLLSPFLFFI